MNRPERGGATAARVTRTAAPLRREVVRLMREDILNGQLLPGQRLVENALCLSYGVSRTVVREAMRQLESEHLVQVLPAQGPIVAVLTEAEIRAIYEVRARLEGMAGRLFSERADAADLAAMLALRERIGRDYLHGSVESREEFGASFYRLLLAGSGNPVLAETLRAIHARVALFRRYAFVDDQRVALSADHLVRIFDAVAANRDPARAEAACARHISVAGELALVEYRRRAPGIRRTN